MHAQATGDMLDAALFANQPQDRIEPIGAHAIVAMLLGHFSDETAALAIGWILPFWFNVTE